MGKTLEKRAGKNVAYKVSDYPNKVGTCKTKNHSLCPTFLLLEGDIVSDPFSTKEGFLLLSFLEPLKVSHYIYSLNFLITFIIIIILHSKSILFDLLDRSSRI